MSIEPPSYEDINHDNNDAYRVSHPDQILGGGWSLENMK